MTTKALRLQRQPPATASPPGGKAHKLDVVMELLGICYEHTLSLIDSNQLAAFDVSRPCAKRRSWRVTQEAIDDFIRRRSTKKNPEPKPCRRRRAATSNAIEFF